MASPPLLSPYFSLVKWVVFIQLSAIVITALYGLSFRKIQDFLQKRYVRKTRTLETLIQSCISEKILPTSLSKYTLHDVLTAVLETDKKLKDPHWEEIKLHFFQKIIFPKARRMAYSFRWTKRMLAARCFLACIDSNNEKYILHLLKDSIPIVQYSAAYSAAKLGTSKCILAVIEEMNKSERFLRQPFIHALTQEINKIFLYVEELLQKTEDPYTKVSCLEVLSHRMNKYVAECAQRDLYSSHKNLRLTAIRALGCFPHRESEELLKPLLNDPDWEVRAISVTSLSTIGARKSMPQIELLLKDDTWWVRMNAALALKRLGEEGEVILKAQDPNVDRYAYEIARYVLPLEIKQSETLI